MLSKLLGARTIRQMIRTADAARDTGRARDAAAIYEAILKLQPQRAGLHVQAGHMRKEAGELAAAEAHYQAAERARPNDADLALQLGHLNKVWGRPEEAERYYARALTLQPDWGVAREELDHLRRHRSRRRLHEAYGLSSESFADQLLAGLAGPADASPPASPLNLEKEQAELLRGRAIARLMPQLAPRRPFELLVNHHEHLEISRLGRREQGFWGIKRTLRGLEAIRGFANSLSPVLNVQIFVNGLAVFKGAPKGGYALALDRHPGVLRKYVFNVWLDFSQYGFGLHEIEVRMIRADGARQTFIEDVVIAEPLAESDYPECDALLTLDPDSDRSPDEQVRARLSIVRPAVRALFADGVRNVLVLRTDQLGDMVASIPALTRLREIVPDARIVGLLTGANAEFARTLDLFDEIIVVDFPDDKIERRRLMPLETQEDLRRRLEPYCFDIALDLAQSLVSRELLALSGARFTSGVGGGDWPWMTNDFIFNTHDRISGLDVVSHSSKVLAMIEALGAVLKASAPIIRRADLTRDMLAEYGLTTDEPYAVLHMGARVEFSRWPYYPALASMLLERTNLKIVMMTEDPLVRGTIPEELLASDRVIYLDSRLPFDHFDAFISFATVMVGNDSGPKHLASLRGTNVVTIFTARISWAEWGQENVGSIISRKVPCQGCLVFHNMEDCGKDFACIVDITADEVLAAVMLYLAGHLSVPAPALAT